MAAPALLAEERAAGDRFTAEEHRSEIPGQVPAGVEFPGARHRDPRRLPLQRADLLDRLLEVRLDAKDSDQRLHRRLKPRVDVVRRGAAGPLERSQHLALGRLDLC